MAGASYPLAAAHYALPGTTRASVPVRRYLTRPTPHRVDSLPVTIPARLAADATAANVRAEMARRRVTQTQLAEATGISQSALGRRLTGSQPFDVAQLEAIAGALAVPLADLVAA